MQELIALDYEMEKAKLLDAPLVAVKDDGGLTGRL